MCFAAVCSEKPMKHHIYCRIAGHIIIVISLSLPLLYNLIKIELARYKDVRAEIELFAKLRFKYATIWNAILIMVYGVFGIFCDWKILKNDGPDILARYRNYSYIIFTGIIFPISTSVLLFWPIFIYDRELIYRSIYDDVINVELNYIVHGLVFVYAVWEMVFLPRDAVKENRKSWYLMHVFNAVYVIVVLYTRYVDLGVWTYEILVQTAGRPVFFVWLFSVWAMSWLGYWLQWRLKSAIWWYRDKQLRSKVA